MLIDGIKWFNTIAAKSVPRWTPALKTTPMPIPKIVPPYTVESIKSRVTTGKSTVISVKIEKSSPPTKVFTPKPLPRNTTPDKNSGILRAASSNQWAN